MNVKCVSLIGVGALALILGGPMVAYAGQSTSFGEAGTSIHVDRTITLIVKKSKLNIRVLKIRPQETVRFVIKNHDEVTHRFSLGPQDPQLKDQGEMDTTVPWAVSIPAGKTRGLIWKFGSPGKVKFNCDIPGRSEAGMSGIITVAR